MQDLGIPFRLTEVDGVPCFYADAPGPCTAGLLFRVGRADELLTNGGVTRLVEQLALHDLGRRPYDYSGHVTTTTTAFYASGDPAQLGAFLTHVCRAVHDLPAERVDGERRALAIEEERDEPDAGARLLMMRFGAQGHGLPFYDQFGLRWLQPDHLAGWARQWFTRGNSALWMTQPPPAGLRLPLPEGPRMPPPEAHTMAGLDLPAYAASGTSGVASTMLAPRSAAIRMSARAVAGRTEAALRRRGLDYEAAPWQFPLAAGLSHRQLAVECPEDDAAKVVEAVTGAYDAVASDGPSRGELDEGREAAIRALADDEAVPGGLEAMAVDELLGARPRWKDDLAAELAAVTQAEATAALREALTTQLLVAPASVPKPSQRLHDYPWFSRDRVQGHELKPAQRNQPVRVVVGADGVSHVSQDSGQASTVRFQDVAAALQESDGSLTLIGRDGAIVPLDPQALRGGGEAISDLERRLPPQVIVPPRDTIDGQRGGINAVAGRKLGRRLLVEAELGMLPQRLGQEESVLTMAEATIGFKGGLLVVTDQRVLWLSRGDRETIQRELSYGDVTDVRMSRFPKDVVTLRSPAGETAFSQVRPKERGPEIVEEVQRRVAAARGAQAQ